MMNEDEKIYLEEKANATIAALRLGGLNVMFSWGVSKMCAIYYEEMPTLAMKVQGFLHRGWVYVSYNGGEDLYEVRTMDENGEPKKTLTGFILTN